MKKLLLFLLLAFGITYAQAQEHHMASNHSSHYHHRSRHKQHSMSHHSSYAHHNIKVNNDAMDNPYHGKNSRQNDGAKKNDHRNMNANTGQPLPPSDGGK